MAHIEWLICYDSKDQYTRYTINISSNHFYELRGIGVIGVSLSELSEYRLTKRLRKCSRQEDYPKKNPLWKTNTFKKDLIWFWLKVPYNIWYPSHGVGCSQSFCLSKIWHLHCEVNKGQIKSTIIIFAICTKTMITDDSFFHERDVELFGILLFTNFSMAKIGSELPLPEAEFVVICADRWLPELDWTLLLFEIFPTLTVRAVIRWRWSASVGEDRWLELWWPSMTSGEFSLEPWELLPFEFNGTGWK